MMRPQSRDDVARDAGRVRVRIHFHFSQIADVGNTTDAQRQARPVSRLPVPRPAARRAPPTSPPPQ